MPFSVCICPTLWHIHIKCMLITSFWDVRNRQDDTCVTSSWWAVVLTMMTMILHIYMLYIYSVFRRYMFVCLVCAWHVTFGFWVKKIFLLAAYDGPDRKVLLSFGGLTICCPHCCCEAAANSELFSWYELFPLTRLHSIYLYCSLGLFVKQYILILCLYIYMFE